jgi:hypothetical protein
MFGLDRGGLLRAFLGSFALVMNAIADTCELA